MTGLKKVRHHFTIARDRREVLTVTDQKQARHVRGKSGLVKIHANGIRLVEMLEPKAYARQGPQGAGAKAEFVRLEVIIVEYRPSPPDYRVRVHVRHVVELIFLGQTITKRNHDFEIVDAKGIRRSHGREDARHSSSRSKQFAEFGLVEIHPHGVVDGGGNGNDIFLTESQPAGNAKTRVMALTGRENHRGFAESSVHGPGKGLFESDLAAIEISASSAKGENPADFVGS
ncbi:MAG: hypothetical protein U1D30_23775 [Planctomycetota bacterium]